MSEIEFWLNKNGYLPKHFSGPDKRKISNVKQEFIAECLSVIYHFIQFCFELRSQERMDIPVIYEK
jgi:hypothetical protein